MRVAVSLALVALSAASSVAAPTLKAQWEAWKVANKRSYDATEEAVRFAHFEQNLAQMAELTRRHAHKRNGARFAANKFADRSPAELKVLRSTRIPKDFRKGVPVVTDIPQASPENSDWRKFVSPIQDQGQCGSCWAFSATSNIETVWAIKNNLSTPLKLSEQYLVDCDTTCGTYSGEQGCDQGCNGGLMPNAFHFVMYTGQPSEASYPYLGYDGTCANSTRRSPVELKGFRLLPQSEDAIAAYVGVNGPVSVAVDASEWSWYIGGIMEYLCWGTTTSDDLDHGVNIVGYGVDDGTPYWIMRNSWGTSWGEDGWARIIRGKNFCGIDLMSSTAISA